MLHPLRRPVALFGLFVLLLSSCTVDTDTMENVTVTDAGRAAAATAPTPNTTDQNGSAGSTPPAEADTTDDPAQDGPAQDDGSAGDDSSDDNSSDDNSSDDNGEETPVANAGSAGAGDNYYPTYGNGGYDVASYDLDLDWDHTSRLLEATATITFAATQPLGQFNLDLIGFEVGGVAVNGVDADFSRDGRELIITPPTPLALDDLATVTVTYAGSPTLLQSIGAPFSTGWTDLGDTIVVAGEPEGAAGWYPVNEHPIDKATYRISVTTAADLTVASNGTQVSVADNGETKTWIYESANPQASYLTTLAIGDFERHDGAPSESGVPVRHFFHTDLVDEGIATMERTGQMIDAFEDIFGPYPFENYGTVVVDADLGFALETQTLSVFGADLVDAFGSREDVVAHELAHQWFGNHVSLTQWSDIWLNEGFATYSEYLWRAASEPNYDIDQAVRTDYENLGFLLDVPPGAPAATDLFNASVYLRGAFTLHALRITIGDDAFFQLIDTYVTEYGGGNALTRDFTSLAEAISGQDLEAFFDAWLFTPGVPDLPR